MFFGRLPTRLKLAALPKAAMPPVFNHEQGITPFVIRGGIEPPTVRAVCVPQIPHRSASELPDLPLPLRLAA